jgi:site-specific recombinase XerD
VLRSYIIFLREKQTRSGQPLSATSLNGYVRSLRAFCTWLFEEAFVDVDLFARVKVPKAPRLAKPTLDANEIGQLLLGLNGARNALRDEALILFMLDTGARASEVVAMSGIDWTTNIARLSGKGSKERLVPFSQRTAIAMQRYAVRERKNPSGPFFQTDEGVVLTRRGLTQIFARLSRRTGIKVSPHMMRHTFSINYLRSGGNVFALQKTLGHESLDTTRRYSNLAIEDLIEEHRDHSPVDAMVKIRRKR